MQRIHGLMKVFAMVLAIAVVVGHVDRAQAGDGQINLRITKAGFVVGVTGGSGSLVYQGHTYGVSISGLRVGLTIGASSANLHGKAYNLNQPSDIEGTYSSVGASAAFGPGGNAVVLQNENGVRLELHGDQVGVEASLDVGGMVLSLN